MSTININTTIEGLRRTPEEKPSKLLISEQPGGETLVSIERGEGDDIAVMTVSVAWADWEKFRYSASKAPAPKKATPKKKPTPKKRGKK